MTNKFDEIKQRYDMPEAYLANSSLLPSIRTVQKDIGLLLKALELACSSIEFGHILNPDHFLEEAQESYDKKD